MVRRAEAARAEEQGLGKRHWPCSAEAEAKIRWDRSCPTNITRAVGVWAAAMTGQYRLCTASRNRIVYSTVADSQQSPA